jgi:hypothetical protein
LFIIVMSFAVILSPLMVAILLTSNLSRQVKAIVGVAAFAAIVIVPIAVFLAGRYGA